MIKKILCIFCIIALLLSSAGCDLTTAVLPKTTAGYIKGDNSELALGTVDDDSIFGVAYTSDAEIVLAVENGKADMGILSRFAAEKYIGAGREIEITKTLSYTVDYSVYFNKDNYSLFQDFCTALSVLESNGTVEKIRREIIEEGYCQTAEIQDFENSLTMLCDPNFEDFVFLDGDGTLQGFDVALAEEICNYLGYSVNFSSDDFHLLFSQLDLSEGDFLMTHAEYTPQRAESYLYCTYYTEEYCVIKRSVV